VSDYVAFEGAVEPLEWGRAVYTILPLPSAVVAALGGAKRVEGEINEHPVNLGIARADVVEGAFPWTGKAFLKDAGIEVGKPLEVRLKPAPADLVEMPGDLEAALCAHDLTGPWEALTPGKRRGLIHPVQRAKRPETRAKRIAALLADLCAGQVS